ncbi:hypothetical protein ACFPH6_33000 [Streptomyces xiangluensis]|uniref:Uncharacterized protein n=1 Tax=Streptomyces xiangluensis TaxID=2665720 RepID=A0ABV8YVP2_9ACTN
MGRSTPFPKTTRLTCSHGQSLNPGSESFWITIAWCVGLIALGYRWSTAQFNRDPK